MNSTELRPTATLPPVTLTPDEAAAVVVALAARPDGLAPDARGALEKVLAALEPDPLRRSGLLAAGLEVSAGEQRAAELRSMLERAVTGGLVLGLRYRDGRGRVTRREVEPQLVARSEQHWFLVAWCRERQALRWFRADRIQHADPTGEQATRRDLAGLGAPPAGRHPAGRALRGEPAGAARRSARAAGEPAPPRLIVLPGGRSDG